MIHWSSWISPSLPTLDHGYYSLIHGSPLFSPIMGKAPWKNSRRKPPYKGALINWQGVWRGARIDWSQQMEISRLRKWTAGWIYVSFPWLQIYNKINTTYHQRLMAFQKQWATTWVKHFIMYIWTQSLIKTSNALTTMEWMTGYVNRIQLQTNIIWYIQFI